MKRRAGNDERLATESALEVMLRREFGESIADTSPAKAGPLEDETPSELALRTFRREFHKRIAEARASS